MAERPYKIVLAGEIGVGKSSILRQLQREIHGVDEGVTKSGRSHEKLRARVSVEGQQEPVLVDLWDTVGMELHGSQNIPSRSYFVGTQGVILVYDKEKNETLTALNLWINNAKDYSNIKEGQLVLSLWGNQTRDNSCGDDALLMAFAEAHGIQQSMIFSVNLSLRLGLKEMYQKVVQAVHQANLSLSANGKTVTMSSAHAGSTLQLMGNEQDDKDDTNDRRWFSKCGCNR